MLRSSLSFALLILSAALACPAQSPDSALPPQANAAPPSSSAAAPQTAAAKPPASDRNASEDKKKSKKVWTNEEVSHINGNVSVIGSDAPASSSSSSSSPNPSRNPAPSGSRDKQLTAYRDQLRKLRIQLETTEKNLSDLRNFKGDNSSSSGGINMTKRYYMIPIADQIKQLEAKKIQLQDQIDSVESDARKNGFDPGDLR